MVRQTVEYWVKKLVDQKAGTMVAQRERRRAVLTAWYSVDWKAALMDAKSAF